MSDKADELISMMEAHPGNPDRVYMDIADFHTICQKAGSSSGGVPRTKDCKLFGMDVVISSPYGREDMLVLDSDNYPKARDFKEGRVSAEKL